MSHLDTCPNRVDVFDPGTVWADSDTFTDDAVHGRFRPNRPPAFSCCQCPECPFCGLDPDGPMEEHIDGHGVPEPGRHFEPAFREKLDEALKDAAHRMQEDLRSRPFTRVSVV